MSKHLREGEWLAGHHLPQTDHYITGRVRWQYESYHHSRAELV